LQVYHRIQSHLRILRTLSFVHVRKNANRLADQLTNEGVLCKRDNSKYMWELAPAEKLREDCHILPSTDSEHYHSMNEKQQFRN